MKRIILELYPITANYKGHRVQFLHLAKEVALFNGKFRFPEEGMFDTFIERVFKEEVADLKLEKVDETTYQFGHYKTLTKEYVVYGRIIKVHIL